MEVLDDRSVIYQLEVYKKWYEEQQKEIERLNNGIDKANNILKDTNVDMPETLLIETIDYARHILNGGDEELKESNNEEK